VDLRETDEQALLRESLRRFFGGDVLDGAQRKRTLKAGREGAVDLWRKVGQQGWLGISVPDDRGGFGATLFEEAIVAEEMGRALVPVPYVLAGIRCATLLQAAGSASDAALAALISGESLISLALDDAPERPVALMPACGGASAHRLSGKKITVFGAGTANQLLVLARRVGHEGTDDEAALIRVCANTPGVDIAVWRGIDEFLNADISFDNVTVRPEDVLLMGRPVTAAIAAAQDYAIVMTGAEMVGACEAVLLLTTAYTKERNQFGKPLFSLQAVQHRIADMFIELRSLQAVVRNGMACCQRADHAGLHRAAAQIIVQMAHSVQFITGNGIQLFGGLGVSDEMLIGQYFKRWTAVRATFGRTDTYLAQLADDYILTKGVSQT
jgi:alkylation response protein AidB-like acyl-CoA dehydrogenase